MLYPMDVQEMTVTSNRQREYSSLDGYEGMLLVDKPTGVTSHDVVQWARRQTGHRKIGHTGTLDPLATGLLVLLITRPFTKLQAQFLKQDKSYLVTARLGETTDSYDRDGQRMSLADWNSVASVTRNHIEFALKKYHGQIEQQVPIFSAVKMAGKKLYEHARAGEVDSIQLPSRLIIIHSCKLESFDSNDSDEKVHFTLSVRCSSGTYIRSLVHDIGQDLGVGATVTALRRTEIGSMHIDDAQLCPLIVKKRRNS